MSDYQHITNLKGSSAYELAVKHGFTGTEQEWLDSLHGNTEIVAHEHVAEPTDFDALRGPVPLYYQVRANNVINGPANVRGGNVLLTLEVLRGAVNGILQRLTSVHQSWWRYSVNNSEYGDWVEVPHEPVSSTQGAPRIQEGELGIELDPRHTGIFLDGSMDPAEFDYYSTGSGTMSGDFNFFNVSDFFPADLGAHIVHLVNDRFVAAWARHGQFADGEVLVRANASGLDISSGVTGAAGAILRADLSEGTGYYAGVATSTVSGQRVLVLTITYFSPESGANSMQRHTLEGFNLSDPYVVRFRAEGDQLMAKLWNIGDEEPAQWQASTADTRSAVGHAGFGRIGAAARPSRFNYLAINRAGGTA